MMDSHEAIYYRQLIVKDYQQNNQQSIVQQSTFFRDALRWLARQGIAKVQYALAYSLLVVNEPIQASLWCRTSAILGFAPGQALFGSMLMQGQGVPMDVRAGLHWLLMAAEQLDPHAMYQLGSYYEKQTMNTTVHRMETAMDWFKKASMAGSVDAMNVLGILYENGQSGIFDHYAAKKYFTRASRLGHRHAQFNLGRLLHEGTCSTNDLLALEWMIKAAKQEHDNALLTCGIMYELGVGVEQNMTLAQGYYEQAHQLGNIEAGFRLKSVLAQQIHETAQLVLEQSRLPHELWLLILNRLNPLIFNQNEFNQLLKPGTRLVEEYVDKYQAAHDYYCHCRQGCQRVAHVYNALVSLSMPVPVSV